MKNQTAIDWLIQELNLHGYDFTVQRAKELEKQQIIDAYEDFATNEIGELLTGEQYYNQTYEK